MEFSVIIVSFNNLDILISCLDSIFIYNDIGSKLEVIVIENSPTNTVYDYIKDNYHSVKCIKNNNKGFGQGNNIGAKEAKGKYFLFLNPDTILIEPVFKFAIDKFSQQKKLGLFGVKLIDIDKKSNLSFYYLDKFGIIASMMLKIHNKFDNFSSTKMFISGANMFVRRSIFEKVGLFDENIFLFNEEKDLTRRIKESGYYISYFWNKRIIHLEGKTIQGKNQMTTFKLESAFYYSKKHGLDFSRQIKSEIRIDTIKHFIYRVFDKKKAQIYVDDLDTIRKFVKKEKINI